ncbi:hypothetical protein [Ensifer sp. Root127]|uniref:antibiotic biosynthesis monooxygenase family protein n=1 Tax=Ensifer sp. Root127 TaxID=1736440 RepID=UPI00070F2488|nr:hypothetical protein [Ensifer sp. Root127]KQW72462.1 hypothetical protein ASD03_32470 [Ensifer sp. Root127]
MTSNPAIARIWRGSTLPADADEYAEYLYQNGVCKLQAMGAQSVRMLRENRQGETEFMVVSFWDTTEMMTAWAGSDPRKIRHLERDAEFLIELPHCVQILDVVAPS